MKTINKLTLCISKILEVLHWLCAAALAAMFICSLAAGSWLAGVLTELFGEGSVAAALNGFEVWLLPGGVNMRAVTVWSAGAVVTAALFAMVFRNAYLIIRTAKGKTWFSKGDTPFQSDIVRMLREIGIFLIASFVVEIIVSIVLRLTVGVDGAEMSVGIQTPIIGLLMLCLSQFFDYGAHLQQDVDGLL